MSPPDLRKVITAPKVALSVDFGNSPGYGSTLNFNNPVRMVITKVILFDLFSIEGIQQDMLQ